MGCVPGFGQFTRVDPSSDAGPPVDGSAPDAGIPDGAVGRDAGPFDGGGCPGGLLSCAPTCDALFERVIAEATFDADFGDFSFTNVTGSAAVTSGHLVLDPTDTWLLTRGTWSYGSVIACAEVEVAFDAVDTSSAFLFGLRGSEHGTLVRAIAERDFAELVTFEPERAVADAAPWAVPEGGATERYVVLSFAGAGFAHGEVRRVATGDVLVLHGSYFGDETTPLQVELSFATVSGVVRVDWLRVGRPTTEALAWLEAG